jgi:DnaK suppressor protein
MTKIEKMHRERHQALRTMLEERRREIMEKLRSIREAVPAAAADVTDAEEQSVNDFVQDIDFALMQMKAESLQRIDEALARLQEGTYGTCAECEVEIAQARLAALPFATLCIGCQEEQERNEPGARRPYRATFDEREVGPS